MSPPAFARHRLPCRPPMPATHQVAEAHWRSHVVSLVGLARAGLEQQLKSYDDKLRLCLFYLRRAPLLLICHRLEDDLCVSLSNQGRHLAGRGSRINRIALL